MSKARPITRQEEFSLKVNPKQFGRMLMAKREAVGLSKNELARQLKVSPGTIKRWESGLVDPPGIRLLNWLLEGELPNEGMWRVRALVAESALRDMNRALGEYRSAMKPETNQ